MQLPVLQLCNPARSTTISRVEPKIAKLLGRAPSTSNVQTTSGRGHYVFIAHVDTAPFDNNELRLALKHALDRQEMVDKILQGLWFCRQ